ncbi:MAG TPA: T9SS C-terminal target domain-containing protein, partial [Flavobacterium sp.]|nr:T9SS C-terminal target domain-containing protein [Flavobacterium sp.]
NSQGVYTIPISAGSYTLTPQNPNSDYFSISPESVTIAFPDEASPYTQNFCLSPNGEFYDLEITLVPTVPAQPGFDAEYRLIYRNKGTETESVSVDFNFNDSLLDFVSASITPNGVGIGNLNWENFELKPFEEKVIDIILNVNSPQEDPAVNNGDELIFSASIGDMIPENMDETPGDNTAELAQIVVGSFDPNDKTCLEGDNITVDMVGEYVTYLIRFENTGDYYAENIVVVDMIDLEKFEISTLTPLQSSHEYVTRITEGNKVEFIFENIMLPGMPSEDRHGYVAFKIKTKETLQLDDSFSNTAAIYFDFNHPIITNEAVTTVTILNTADFDFNTDISLYPNPTSGI